MQEALIAVESVFERRGTPVSAKNTPQNKRREVRLGCHQNIRTEKALISASLARGYFPLCGYFAFFNESAKTGSSILTLSSRNDLPVAEART